MTMASAFEILPAIDLRGGRVVRLERGDFARETAFSDDPVAVARAFADAGARWLHVVDLDGARSGAPAHTEVIVAIVGAVGRRVAVEVAGGLRSADAVGAILTGGAARVVVGTAALRDPRFAGSLVGTHGADRIAVAIDVRDGRAHGDGWDAQAVTADASEAIRQLAEEGVETFEVTAIDRDGRLIGPDLDLLARMVGLGRGRIIASAGISEVNDIRAVEGIGCAGAIIGRALYDGRFSLQAALGTVSNGE
jgi:phosphoribosylformimino-5-aminoimidazole carboxamide ribotide isomerase